MLNRTKDNSEECELHRETVELYDSKECVELMNTKQIGRLFIFVSLADLGQTHVIFCLSWSLNGTCSL